MNMELPAKLSASCSECGGKAGSRIVTALSGCKSCTSRSDLPSFLRTQNQRDLYDEFDGSYVPERILSLTVSMT